MLSILLSQDVHLKRSQSKMIERRLGVSGPTKTKNKKTFLYFEYELKELFVKFQRDSNLKTHTERRHQTGFFKIDNCSHQITLSMDNF